MVDPRAVERALQGILGQDDFDLRLIRGLVEAIVLPADPDASPLLRAFGVEFQLETNMRKSPYGEGRKAQGKLTRRLK